MAIPPIRAKHHFTPKFYRPFDMSGASGLTPSIDDADKPIRYDPTVHSTHASFETGGDFGRYESQFRQRIKELSDFVQQHRLPDAEVIADQLDWFLQGRFGPEPRFDGRKPVIDGLGKQSLDEFCAWARSGKLPAHTVGTAIRELAQGTQACADGATTQLVMASRSLALEASGLQSELWRVKEAVIKSVIDEVVTTRFSRTRGFTAHHIHHVSGLWDQFAGEFGLQPLNDLTRTREVRDDETLRADVLDRINEVLTPGRLALLIADDALAAFRDGLSGRLGSEGGSREKNSADRIWHELKGSDDSSAFVDALESIKRRFGSTLQMGSFVELSDDGTKWSLVGDPTAAAVDMLKAMQNESLLPQMPELLGHWKADESGASMSLFGYGGTLLWAIRSQPTENLGPQHALSAGYERELLTVDGLHRWLDSLEAGTPRSGAKKIVDWNQPVSAHLLSTGEAAQLTPLFPAYFRTAEQASALFEKLDDEATLQRLQQALPGLADAIPKTERPALIDYLVQRKLAPKDLLKAWYPTPVTLAVEGRGHYGTPRITWMIRNGQARGFRAINSHIDEYHLTPGTRKAATLGTARQDGLWTESVKRDLIINCRMNLNMGFGHAMMLGHVGSIRAWIERILSVARDPESVYFMLAGDTIPPPLSLAIAHNRGDSIDEFGDALNDNNVLAHLNDTAIKKLLVAAAPQRSDEPPHPALHYAAKRDCGNAVIAYGRLLEKLYNSETINSDQIKLLLSDVEFNNQTSLGSAPFHHAVDFMRGFGEMLLQLRAKGALDDAFLRSMLRGEAGRPDVFLSALLCESNNGDFLAAFCEVLGSAIKKGVFGKEPSPSAPFARESPDPLTHTILSRRSTVGVKALFEMLNSESIAKDLGDKVLQALADQIKTFRANVAAEAIAEQNYTFLDSLGELLQHHRIKLDDGTLRAMLFPGENSSLTLATVTAHSQFYSEIIKSYTNLLLAAPRGAPTAGELASALLPSTSQPPRSVMSCIWQEKTLTNKDLTVSFEALGSLFRAVNTREFEPSPEDREAITTMLIGVTQRDYPDGYPIRSELKLGATNDFIEWAKLLDHFPHERFGEIAFDVLLKATGPVKEKEEGAGGVYAYACSSGHEESVKYVGEVLVDRLKRKTISPEQFAKLFTAGTSQVQRQNARNLNDKRPRETKLEAIHWKQLDAAAPLLEEPLLQTLRPATSQQQPQDLLSVKRFKPTTDR